MRVSLRDAFLLILVNFVHSQYTPAASNSSLSFQVNTGGNENYFLRDEKTTAQVLVTSANSSDVVRRVVVALPAGNSGALVYFLPRTNLNGITGSLDVELQNGTLSSTTDPYENVGVQADFKFSTNATLGVTIIGAVRAMRDYVEGSGTMHEIFNYTLASFNSTSIRLHRQWINATSDGSFRGADLWLNARSGVLDVIPGNNGTFTPPNININVNGSGGGIVQLRVLTNETSLEGLSPKDLFLPEGSGSTAAINTALENLSNAANHNAQEVSFLTFRDKFTAGGWRFLTYFGRDSMIALRLLMPILTSDAIEAALGAVIERVNITGALCHEETIGDYASFVNLGNNRPDLGNQPFYDYKMIDTDLYLLPTMSHYFLDLPQGRGRAAQFMAKNASLQEGSYSKLLNKTVMYNLQRAYPFALSPTFSNLLRFRPGQPVGNWRDSNQGTGYGPIPFDVNSALVPANLRATARLARAGIIPNIPIHPSSLNQSSPITSPKTREKTNSKLPSPSSPHPPGLTVSPSSLLADVADAIAEVWEQHVTPLFEVHVNQRVAEDRLENFVRAANLSSRLLTEGEDDDGALRGDKIFYALSLMPNGTPVEVLNSDIGFNLLYGTNVTQTFLQRTIEALQPYPRGLLTNIGMVVANPAFDHNTTNIDVLNRPAYHGTVIWSWQQGLMASGLARQLGFCKIDSSASVDIDPVPNPVPSWCTNSTFVQSLSDAQARLWISIKGGINELFTEVWSYSYSNATNTFSVADLATISPDGTESDAIQLWSYGFLALLDPSGGNVG